MKAARFQQGNKIWGETERESLTGCLSLVKVQKGRHKSHTAKTAKANSASLCVRGRVSVCFMCGSPCAFVYAHAVFEDECVRV